MSEDIVERLLVDELANELRHYRHSPMSSGALAEHILAIPRIHEALTRPQPSTSSVEAVARAICGALYGPLEDGSWAVLSDAGRDSLRRCAEAAIAALPSPEREPMREAASELYEALEECHRYVTQYGTSRAVGQLNAKVEAALAKARGTPAPAHIVDPWNPDPEDPFWMLEIRQGFEEAGSWLKNEETYLTTRDPIKALRYPSFFAADCARRRLPLCQSGRFEPTEHTWMDSDALSKVAALAPPPAQSERK